jgi:hypothetical protein
MNIINNNNLIIIIIIIIINNNNNNIGLIRRFKHVMEERLENPEKYQQEKEFEYNLLYLLSKLID